MPSSPTPFALPKGPPPGRNAPAPNAPRRKRSGFGAQERFRATAELLQGPVTFDKVSRTGKVAWSEGRGRAG